MLPRFYVYHQESAPGSREDKAWIEREARLAAIILNPALLIVWLLGLALAVDIDAFHQGWFHAKLACVVLLSAYHGWAIGYGRKLAAGRRTASDKALRLMNEIPGIATAVIVVLVIVKPF